MASRIMVGWVGHRELGELECEVVETKDLGGLNVFDEATPTKVCWFGSGGKVDEITWLASQQRWVFTPRKPRRSRCK
jgi:hypothetical protein